MSAPSPTPPAGRALVAIRCPQHGATMQQRPAFTPEQRFCGAWWRCEEGRCQFTILYPSIELRAQLEAL